MRQLEEEKSQQEYKLRELHDLKNRNGQLERDLQNIQQKLRESNDKLGRANQQI